MNVPVWLAIGGLVGLAAARLWGSPERFVMNVVVGMLGAFVGGWAVAPIVGDGTMSSGNFSVGSIVLSLLGAVSLLAVVKVEQRFGPRRDAVDVSRMPTGRLEVVCEPVPVNKALEAALRLSV